MKRTFAALHPVPPWLLKEGATSWGAWLAPEEGALTGLPQKQKIITGDHIPSSFSFSVLLPVYSPQGRPSEIDSRPIRAFIVS